MADEGKKVFFLVYNLKLKEKLQEELVSKQIVVNHFHGLCRELNSSKESEDEDYVKETLPRAFLEAVKGNRLPEYDALIVDEAQVLKQEWLQGFSDWFKGKPILICCDETQVFPFEANQASSVNIITQAIGVNSPFTLTTNLRSPARVFKRLSELQPANYQQFSPRQYEQDTLEEYADFDIERLLYITLHTLRKQGVNSKDVTVVYTGRKEGMERIQELTSGLFNEMEPIYRYRGLEAPIIIVYANGAVDDNTIACAYARATSRCIVIYHIFDFIVDRYGSDFTRNLLSSSDAPANIVEAAQRIGKPHVTSEMHMLDMETVHLGWIPEWNGWLIDEAKSPDKISAQLWWDFLAISSSQTVHYLYKEYKGDVYVNFQEGQVDFDEDLSQQRYSIGWCYECQNWKPLIRQVHNLESHSICTTCSGHFSSPTEMPVREMKLIQQVDNVLKNPHEYSKEVKSKLPLSVIALGQWRKLSTAKRFFISRQVSSRTPQHIGKHVAEILFQIHVVNTPPGEIVVLDAVREKTYNLSNQKLVSEEIWSKWMAYRVNRVLKVGLIEKVGQGKYKRMFNLDTDTRE